jgi:hypothetical protein
VSGGPADWRILSNITLLVPPVCKPSFTLLRVVVIRHGQSSTSTHGSVRDQNYSSDKLRRRMPILNLRLVFRLTKRCPAGSRKGIALRKWGVQRGKSVPGEEGMARFHSREWHWQGRWLFPRQTPHPFNIRKSAVYTDLHVP